MPSGAGGLPHQGLALPAAVHHSTWITYDPFLLVGVRAAVVIISNARRSPSVGTMLGQRLRRWTNIVPTLGERAGWDLVLSRQVSSSGNLLVWAGILEAVDRDIKVEVTPSQLSTTPHDATSC